MTRSSTSGLRSLGTILVVAGLAWGLWGLIRWSRPDGPAMPAAAETGQGGLGRTLADRDAAAVAQFGSNVDLIRDLGIGLIGVVLGVSLTFLGRDRAEEARPPEAGTPDEPGIRRRNLFVYGANLLGGAMGLALAVPGVAYLLTPLGRRGRDGDFRSLPVTLAELPVGVPRQFPIVEERTDAWVKYPAEPVGSVWLVRQPEGARAKVVAFTAECPHLGCAVNLAADGQSFFCPCHASAFRLDGERLNPTPPRPMDTLEVEVPEAEGAPIRVKFRRFRTQSKEKTPLV